MTKLYDVYIRIAAIKLCYLPNSHLCVHIPQDHTPATEQSMPM